MIGRLDADYGGLADYWYPLIAGRDLKPDTLQRVQALGIQLIIWVNRQGEPAVFLDQCPHRQVPLSAGQLKQQQLRCAYHGWIFDHQGICQAIPVEPETPCQHIQLVSFPFQLQGEILWFYPGDIERPAYALGPPDVGLSSRAQKGFFCKDFQASVEDLMENFMDSPHTNFVHKGLIRSESQREARQIDIQVHATGEVTVTHEPTHEKIGPLTKLINPSGGPVSHCDHFFPPARLEVTYAFSADTPEFKAFISLCPIDTQTTRAFVEIYTDFPNLNGLMMAGVKLLAPLILKQDYQILALQAENKLRHLPEQEVSTAYDTASLKMRKIRRQIRTRKQSKDFEPWQKQMQVYL